MSPAQPRTGAGSRPEARVGSGHEPRTTTRRDRVRAATIDEIKETARTLMREQGIAEVRFTDIARAMASVREAESMAKLKQLGMMITQPDMTEARAKAAEVQKEMAVKLKAEDLLQQILAQ